MPSEPVYVNVSMVKVSKVSKIAAVAGAIAGLVRDKKPLVVQALGNDAINRSVRAITLATRYLAEEGIEISFVPTFMDISTDTVGGAERSLAGIRFVVMAGERNEVQPS